MKIDRYRYRHYAVETRESRTQLAHALPAQPAQIEHTVHFRQTRRIERRQTDAPTGGLAQVKLEQGCQQWFQPRQGERSAPTVTQGHDDFCLVGHRFQCRRTPFCR